MRTQELPQNSSRTEETHQPQTKSLDAAISRDEFFAMLQNAKDGKDRAILCMGILGLRADEIAHATADWVDLSRRTITIPSKNAKRGKYRVVPFGGIRICVEVLTAFFALSPEGLQMRRETVWYRVKGMASRAKVPHPVTAHGLRATGAMWMAQAGYSITGLLSHFGWGTLKTAVHYIAASGASAIRDMEEKGHNIM
jgi:integrase